MIRRLALCAAFLLLPAASSKAEGNIWDGLRAAGSPSLFTWALSEPTLPIEALALRNRMLTEAGFIGARGSISNAWHSASPVLSYDTNLNGGFPSASIVVSGLTFEIDEKYERLAGVLVGGTISGGFAVPVADGLAWRSQGFALYAWSPDYRISKMRMAAESCLERMISLTTYLSGCIDASHSAFELGDSASLGMRIGAKNAFSGESALHELRGDLRHGIQTAGTHCTQRTASVRLTSAHSQGYATIFGLQLGTPVEGVLTLRERLEMGITATVVGASTTILASAQESRGGRWLGSPRSDRTYGVTISRILASRMDASLSVSSVVSSADFFTETTVGGTLNYRF